MRHVIIGASFAALNAAKAILSNESDDEVVVLSKEKDAPYYRPLISYLLMGKTTEEKMRMSFPESVKIILGTEAERIDTKKKEVIASNGKRYKYDRLLISTGSRPFAPPFKGLDRVSDEIKTTFMTLEDARKLNGMLDKDKRVLIIGSGLIGLKSAEAILERVKSVDVIDLQNRILPAVLDEVSSEYLKKYLEAKGMRFHLGLSVDEFYEKSARLTDNSTLDFDALVLAVGVKANTSLFEEVGGKVGRGILIDTHSRTNIQNIYAAGDVTESMDISSMVSKPIQIVPNASLQGETAGMNMSGIERTFDNAIPMNATGFFSLHLITAGTYKGELLDLSDENGLRRFYIENDELKGFILTESAIERGGIYTSLIRDRIKLSTLDKNIFKAPLLMAFPKERREKIEKEAQ